MYIANSITIIASITLLLSEPSDEIYKSITTHYSVKITNATMKNIRIEAIVDLLK